MIWIKDVTRNIYANEINIMQKLFFYIIIIHQFLLSFTK